MSNRTTTARGPRTASRFPRRDALVRFFGVHARRPVALSELADLLGTAPEIAAAMLYEGWRVEGDPVPWPEAAATLLDAWPRAAILGALGANDAGVIPAGVQLTRVTWPIPRFVLQAMEREAALARSCDPRLHADAKPHAMHARGLADYVADVLHAAIRQDTLDALRDDARFVRAYHFPFDE
jgi:hypothetical protein